MCVECWGWFTESLSSEEHGAELPYQPVWEDWLWHTVLPLVAYTMLLVGSFKLTRYPRQTLFVIAGSALLLLFVGIHNAWDAVTYITITHTASNEPKADNEQNEPEVQSSTSNVQSLLSVPPAVAKPVQSSTSRCSKVSGE